MSLLEIFKLSEMSSFHWISKGPGSLISFSSFMDQAILICKENHRKDAGRFIWAEGPHSCQGRHNVCGVRCRDLRVLVLVHHTLSFTVTLVHRGSSRCSSCSAEPCWVLTGEQSHWLCCFMTISWTVKILVLRLNHRRHSLWTWANSVNPQLTAQCQFLLLEAWPRNQREIQKMGKQKLEENPLFVGRGHTIQQMDY